MAYLPEIYKDFVNQYPEISKSYDDLADACHKAGPLDKKTRRLVKLAVSVGMNTEGGVRSHARRALQEGISPDEIKHVVLLSFTTSGFPNMIAAYKWVEEVIEKSK